MTAPIDKASLENRLREHGQQHLLAFWDELVDAQRRQLVTQIEGVDLALIDSLYRGEVDQPDWAELARRAEPPKALRLADRRRGDAGAWGATPEQAQRRGAEALRDGKAGVLLVAGGQGSRLGFDKPKSMYPIGPQSGATLLQIHCEKIRATTRRYGRPVRMYLMTSPVTHDDTIAFVKENNRFGLLEDELVIFCQGTMPAVDAATGKLLMDAKDSLFLSPDGHGGTVAALEKSGALEHMRQHGVEQLFYLQVDNPLVPICDPELLGHHLLAESELTSLAVAKSSPQDKLGNFVMIDGRLNVIEYSDFPEEAASRRDADGALVFWAGSVAIHVFDRAFLERSLQLKDSLPFHVARKKAEYIDERGQQVTPTQPNALKFERFIFDLLPHARNPIVVEYAEEDSFAPLKNAPGEPKDTPEYVQRLMLAQHRRWLEAAGATLAEGVQVEISPLMALDAQQVAELVEPGRRFEKSEYLSGE
jgi:UDP-N-acetylglucosamine/UDP-N-acetylgalactosamine diphosphorylase